jgi:hypothetical protein
MAKGVKDMKKTTFILFLTALLTAMVLLVAGALAESDGGEAEWTIMFYMCGSDLESKYGYASQNLEEIADCEYPRSETENIMRTLASPAESDKASASGRVNVLIETGGCKQWHAQDLGMEISTTALQRWRFEGYLDDDLPEGYFLEQTLPLQSMADPETLADFVRWSAENHPAKKYALVLWDHAAAARRACSSTSCLAATSCTWTSWAMP